MTDSWTRDAAITHTTAPINHYMLGKMRAISHPDSTEGLGLR